MMRRRTGPAAAFLGAALLVAAAGCGGGEERTAEEPATAVRVEPVARRSFTEYFELFGTVRGDREATLVFEVGGVVREILADEGAWVKAGDPIARLNDDLYYAQRREAEAAYAVARDIYERSGALREKGGISEFELSRLEHEMEAARARFDGARTQHERATLRAPFDGRVDVRFLDVGDYASPLAPFVRFLDLGAVRIETPVPEVRVGALEVGEPATIVADAWPGRVFEGTVAFLSREVDGSARTVMVDVKAANPDGALLPGMTVRVKMVREVHENAVVIPQDAVVETEKGESVFLASGGRAVERPVTVGGVYAQTALIDAGLAEAESLIVVGNRDLVDGQRIQVID
ncbi:MAG: efflux RND transporter periplasmic adaptor subunit [Candidatus Eisenbacteria bacterium]|nr:efflux RND transporter periplasmic adaptor subunit [Candidatus Eisenbacteria bacterium]